MKKNRSFQRTLSIAPQRVVVKDRVVLPPGEESRFVHEWLAAAEKVRRREGFISMELYQNKKQRRPGYISVLVWKSLEELDKDRAFLKAGGVFDDDFIDAYIALKMKEVTAFRSATHPLEYQMYYAI